MQKLIFALSFAVCAQAWAGRCDIGTPVERQLCNGTNEVRFRNGAGPLDADAHLNDMAYEYAWRLYNYNGGKGLALTHDLPGHDFATRMREGKVALPCGENIAGGQQDALQAVTSWQNSPKHFANMISPQYHKIGTGYYKGFWVQIFSN